MGPRFPRRPVIAALYRACLGLCYPARFRARYGDELTQTLLEARAELRGRGAARIVRFWVRAFADLVASGVRTRLRAVTSLARRHPSAAGSVSRQSSGGFMSSLVHDTRTAVRKLARSPGFTVAVVLSLALGIGANTAFFSITDALLLRPLPVVEPERLVSVFSANERRTYRASTYADYVDFARAGADVFTGVAAYVDWEFGLTAGDLPAQALEGQLVSRNFFSIVQPEMIAGRGFSPADGEQRGPPEVVIGYRLWQRAFGGRTDVAGETIRLTGRPFTVVGVAAEEFLGLDLATTPEVWAPLDWYDELATGFWSHYEAVSYDAQRHGHFRVAMWNAVGRLRPGVSFGQARGAMEAATRDLAERFPDTNGDTRFVLAPTLEAATPLGSRRQTIRFVGLLLGAITLALLIACANVANLLLVRAQHRQREIGVRIALGAGRGRIARQFLLESVTLALAGGAAGLVIAVLGVEALHGFELPGGIPIERLGVELDGPILAYTLSVSLLTGLVFGIVPAFRASRADVARTLRSQTATASRTTARLRSILVAGQVGLTVVLLVGAGLFARSLRHALDTDLGFDASNVVTATVDLGLQRYDAPRARAFFEETLARLHARPEVVRASFTSRPFGERGSGVGTLFIPGRGVVQTDRITFSQIDVGYLETMRIPLAAGRGFRPGDANRPELPVIINATMARRFWPGESAVGQRFNFSNANRPMLEVVGVAGDGTYWDLRQEPAPYVYLPIARDWSDAAGNEMTFVVRTENEPTPLLGLVRQTLRTLDPNVPLVRMATMRDRLAALVLPQRMGAVLLGFFGGLAVTLAALGVYGVVGYAVARRTREIGIRIALGARSTEVVGGIMREGLLPVAGGILAGTGGAVLTVQLTRAFLYGVQPLDPLSFAVAATGLLAVGALAAMLPARRAAGVDPVSALREE